VTVALNVHTNHRLLLGLSLGIYLVLLVPAVIYPALATPPGPERIDRGREVYVSYGCVACHTQQVRGDERRTVRLPDGTERVEVLGVDRRFALDRASRPEDYASDDPTLLGTERVGPDLTTVGVRLPSAQWHYWHLLDPQAVSPGSIMPGLPWLFTDQDTTADGGEEVDSISALGIEGPIFATPDAVALVEYLLSLTAGSKGVR
jgi:cytochrome c oxidase cbb3-type subunit 2